MCQEEAKVCGRNRRHSLEAMQEKNNRNNFDTKRSDQVSKKIRFTETVLRDGQQSLIATRMPTSDMSPIIKTMDEAGFHALEMWGGGNV